MSVSGQIDKILRKKDKKLQLIADDIAAAVKDKLKENLEKNWYSTYSPKSYFRTWDLFDSVTAGLIIIFKCILIRLRFLPSKMIQAGIHIWDLMGKALRVA